jgi:hypothetical protein
MQAITCIPNRFTSTVSSPVTVKVTINGVSDSSLTIDLISLV